MRSGGAQLRLRVPTTLTLAGRSLRFDRPGRGAHKRGTGTRFLDRGRDISMTPWTARPSRSRRTGSAVTVGGPRGPITTGGSAARFGRRTAHGYDVLQSQNQYAQFTERRQAQRSTCRAALLRREVKTRLLNYLAHATRALS